MCQTRICDSIDGCGRGSSCSPGRSSASDHSVKFGGHFVYEETGKHVLVWHSEIGFDDGAAERALTLFMLEHDSRVGTGAMK